MLKTAKLSFLSSAQALGVSPWLYESRWRRNRLLILCYHGISQYDEHEWDSELYMPVEVFRERMELLRRLRCNILPLDVAVELHRTGKPFPPRSVVITFDDGSYDLYRAALPILEEFNYPATVYLTTYYSFYNRPVFDVMSSYLLWKAGPRQVQLPRIIDRPDVFNLALPEERSSLATAIRTYAVQHQFSGEQKDEYLTKLAQELGVDYQSILARRILHIMEPDEVSSMSARGIDIQLHTHRHRTPRDPALFAREITDNSEAIVRLTGHTPRHFCYPSGDYAADFLPWLAQLGVQSATTCDPALVKRGMEPLLLPRLIDTPMLTELEVTSWTHGIADLLPQRRSMGTYGGA